MGSSMLKSMGRLWGLCCEKRPSSHVKDNKECDLVEYGQGKLQQNQKNSCQIQACTGWELNPVRHALHRLVS
jgi:hypothetical protein